MPRGHRLRGWPSGLVPPPEPGVLLQTAVKNCALRSVHAAQPGFAPTG